MNLAIMQPYLFPYIGYWQLIDAVDTFVIYDNIQFTKKGWFNRNNFLLDGKTKLFSVPIKKDSDQLNVVERYLSETAAKDINKIISQLENAYKKAPYFNDVFPLIVDVFKFNERNLFLYIYFSVKEICKYLDINTKIIVSSSIDIDHSLKGQEKVLAINNALNASRYINPVGGTSLYEYDVFNKANIELNFLKSSIVPYNQFGGDFISHLSIIDIMMFNNKEDIKKMLTKFQLLKDIDV
ncbi:WbqC family protein [Gammaproteobacteria bacterium]|nr:WbqC family protein [Gammaproteobacteria bacterium]